MRLRRDTGDGICSILIDALAVGYAPGYARRNASRSFREASGGIRSTFTAVAVSVISALIIVQSLR
jgi:hypothetical protein